MRSVIIYNCNRVCTRLGWAQTCPSRDSSAVPLPAWRPRLEVEQRARAHSPPRPGRRLPLAARSGRRSKPTGDREAGWSDQRKEKEKKKEVCELSPHASLVLMLLVLVMWKSRVTLTIESVTALRNLRAAPADAEAQKKGAAQGGAAEQTPQRDGAARPRPRATATNGRDPTRDPTSREGGRRAGGRRTQALGL